MNIKVPTNVQDWILKGGLAALFTVLLTFAIDYRKENRIDYDNLLDRQAENIVKLEEKISSLEDENKYLHDQVSALGSATYEMPVPMWIKTIDGRMLNLNRSYEETFLAPNGMRKSDYIGKTDEEFWSLLGKGDIGRGYWLNDMEIIANKRVETYKEKATMGGREVDLVVYKFPYWSSSPVWNGRRVMGVGGIAIPAPCD